MQSESLQDAVQDALRSYDDLEELRKSPLSELEAIWPIPPASKPFLANPMKGLAVRRLLDRAVMRLKQTMPDDARLLEERFIHGRQVKELEARSLVSASSFYSRLNRRVMPALVSIVAQMEVEAMTARQQEIHEKTASLPAPTYQRLVGVDHYLNQLWRVLRESVTAPTLPLVVTGLGGIGKTSLVGEALRSWIRQEAPPVERVLFAPFEKMVGGQSAPHALDQILFRLGEQLDLPLAELPDNARRLQRLGERLAQARYIVVLDNIERPDEVELAMQMADVLAPTSQMLFTSRHAFERPDVRPLTLGELPQEHALELLRLEAVRLNYTPLAEAVSLQIVEEVGGHPLALKLVAGQVRRLPVDSVLRSLSVPHDTTRELFTRVYETSWTLLSSVAREILQGLLLLPQEGAEWDWIRVATAQNEAALMSGVDELTTLNLLQVSANQPRIYSMHRLTYHFLEQKAGWATDGETE